MGKFGIGARVRDKYCGKDGVVTGKPRKGMRLVAFDDGTSGRLLKSSLTPVAANDDTPAPAVQEQGEPAEVKFRVGDRVKCEGNFTFDPSVGTVTHNGGHYYEVELDNDPFDDGLKKWNYLPKHLSPLAPEWQPKVGDRVRVKQHRNAFGDVLNFIEPGSEVELTGILDDVSNSVEEGWTAFRTTTQYWIRSDDLEPLPVEGAGEPEEPSYKVGDRVLAKGRGWGKTRDIGFIKTVLDCGAHVEFHDGWTGGHEGQEDDGAANRWYFDFSELEPAPLTIEAGKHYRTRDGRKVGPAEVFTGQGVRRDTHGRDADFYFDGLGSYTKDGIWLAGSGECIHDLIAEWVDEPAVKLAEPADEVAVAPATATPAEPAGKFKVGDRVRVKDSELVGVIATRGILGHMSILQDGSSEPGLEWWEDHELELEDDAADTPVSAGITTGSLVTLAASAKVTGFDPHNHDFVHVVLGTGGAYTLPRAALQVA